MKRTVLLLYLAIVIAFMYPKLAGYKALPRKEESTEPPVRQVLMQSSPKPDKPREKIKVLHQGEILEMDMEEYLLSVLAAEMPASFPDEALKAQAVAARTFAMYCAAAGKHGEAQVCTDFACCQAWQDEQQMQEKWGADYDFYRDKLKSAIAETEGKYMSYDGKAIFAAFHSSSAGKTAACGERWSELPYLQSVLSPESAESVPNYISTLEFAAIDFRDIILRSAPYADFTGEESAWLGPCIKSESGRVEEIEIGGVTFGGTELRSIFSLRSCAFELGYEAGVFRFTVTGYGHGVGMSQYGAKVLAENGSDYTAILAHYYQGVTLS